MSRTPGELSLVEVFLVLLRRRRAVIGFPASLFVLVVVGTLLWPRHYSVDTSFLPQTGGAAFSGAASLAAKFGVALPSNDPSQTPAFYGQVLGSDEIMRQVVLSQYRVGSDTATQTLVSVLDADGESEPLRIEDAIRRLRRLVHVGTQPETGVVEMSVTTDWPDVSFQVATYLLELVNQFNRAQLHQRAAAEHQFMQERVDETAQELRNAEDALDQFLRANRQYQGAPDLVLQHDRLERNVNMRQEVYTSLVQALDNSRLDEARNTPLITIVEPPRLPVQPDRRHLAVKGLIALILGLCFGVAYALLQDAWAEANLLNPEVGVHVAEARASLIRGVRKVTRIGAGSAGSTPGND